MIFCSAVDFEAYERSQPTVTQAADRRDDGQIHHRAISGSLHRPHTC